MESILQLVVSGVALGFVYCLIAIEFTLIWNATSLINFGHDKFVVLGAYMFAGTLILGLGLNIFISLLILMILMGLFGMAVASGIFIPLRNMPSDIYAVMGTIMLSLIIRESIRLIWGATPFTLEGYISGIIRIGDIALPRVYVYIIFVSILLLVAQKLFFTKTKIGKAMRCVAQDKEAASLMGIDVKRNIGITTAISSIICGVIAVLIIPIFSVEINMANMIGLKGFAAGVVGGFGTYSGAIAGGLLIGILENLYLGFGPAIYKDVVAFIILILFLLVKPDGLIGKNAGKSFNKILMKFKTR